MTVFLKKQAEDTGDLPRPMGISARLAGLLYARGCRTEEDMEQFLHPGEGQLHDPMLLFGMAEAVTLIREAVDKKRRIVIYGDYDADGVCATAMLVSALSSMGAEASFRIPSRHTEGYGLNLAAVEELHSEGAGLIITVDNGIKANLEIARCRELGMDVIVTDHHQTGAKLPDANVIICHTLDEDSYPNPHICGAGTAFKLVCALIGEKAAREYLPLSALATAADAVPLLGENRAMVALGLTMINRRECCTGLNAIAAAAGEKRGKGGYSARDLVFQFAPRINAAGRMEDAALAVKLLLETDEAKAKKAAEKLNSLNDRRKQDEDNIVRAAYRLTEEMDITNRRAIVLASEDWNHGVAGIAASRVAERYYRPTVLFGREGDILTGSARSVKGINLYAALAQCEDCFLRFGGHEFAAGITMEAARLPEFISRLDTAFASMYSEDVLIPCRTYEADAELSEMTARLAEEIDLLAPFGEGNPQPVFCTREVALTRLSRMANCPQHIRATGAKADCYAELVGFSMGARFDEFLDMDRADILYVPEINEYMGARRLQLLLNDVRRCPVKDPGAYVEQRRNKFLNAICRNILYNDKCVSVPVKEIGMEEARRLLTGRASGTAALCFTPEGAEDIIGLIGDSERTEVSFTKNLPSPAAYNTAVMAPVMDELTLSRFDNVIIADIEPSQGVLDKLQKSAPHARILRLGKRPRSAVYNELYMDRERFIPYYRAMAAGPTHYSRDTAADYLCEKAGGPQYIAELAVAIMIELGFVKETARLAFVKDAPKRELTESVTYAALMRLYEE